MSVARQGAFLLGRRVDAISNICGLRRLRPWIRASQTRARNKAFARSAGARVEVDEYEKEAYRKHPAVW